jgi:hypothetical protein
MPINVNMREQFLVSTEEETMTTTPDDPLQVGPATAEFMAIGRGLAPSMSGPSGFFNSYGRIYVDAGHIEFAAIECADPYQLPLLIESQHILAGRAIAQMMNNGRRFVLANNNHSGLLNGSAPVWGAHENYLIEKHPLELTELILPFLVTRIYGGAGGVRYPSGEFLAGVRPLSMEMAIGGGTTRQRAIHSTAREEHHVGGAKGMFRYHQILGDGHRSQFNQALQFGATALALKAAIYDKKLPARLRALGFPPPDDRWVALLKKLNVLAKPGCPLTIDPLIVKTQREYCEAARRVVATFVEVKSWIPRLLQDWSDFNSALERIDRNWLAARLDTFAKYELYSRVLQEAGASWQTLPDNRELFLRLTLLDHSYHEFCNPRSLFSRAEAAGLMRHRVGEAIEPGSEPEPFIPEVATRARARARFIRDHHREPGLVMDWSGVHDLEHERWRDLSDPFAEEYQPWESGCRVRRRLHTLGLSF